MATLLHSGRLTYYVTSGTSSPGSGGHDLRGKIVTYLESQDPATNTSYIRIDHYSVHYARTTGNKYVEMQDLKVRCNIGSYGGTYQSKSLGEKTYSRTADTTTNISLGSTYHTVYHNADGTGTLYVNAVYEAKPFGFTYNTQGCSLSVALPNIPRYATITSFTTSNVTPNSFQFNVSADSSIDYVQHSLNGGAWTDSGNQVISGLNPLTQYSIKCRVRRTDSQLWTESGTINVTTTQYAPSITGFSLSGQTLQTFVVNWNANTTIDTVNYSLDGGAWTTGQSGISATSGNFTLSGFSPNTYHTVKIAVRRPDGQVWSSDSSTLGITTLDFAKITGADSINDEGTPYMTFTNPSGSVINAYIEYAGTSIQRLGIPNTGAYTFTLTEAERNLLRGAIPNTTTLGIRYVIATLVNGTATYWSWLDRTFTIVNADPVFTTWTYKDTGGTTTTGGARTTVTLTGSDQKFIKGYSNAEATVSVANKMVAQKQATAKDYTFSISGNNSTTVAYSETNPVTLTIPAVQNAIFTLTANDSRGKSKAVAYTTANFVNYTPLARGIVANNLVTRTGNVSKEATLKLDGTWYSGSFGSVTNSFKTAKYRFKETDSETWSAYTNITLTTGTNVFSYNHTIAGDLGAEGFSIDESFNIQVLIQDELSTLTIDLILASGTPNLAIHKDGVAVKGIYDTNLGGALQVNGPVKIPSVEGYDVTLSSTNHPLQIGLSSGVNLCIDNNEIQARTNGSASQLNLNNDGGTVTVGGASLANLKVKGIIESTYQSGAEGGQLELNKPASGTLMSANTIIDVADNRLRFFQNAHPRYGAYLPLTSGGAVDSNRILTEDTLRGNCAVFAKTDSQSIPATTSTQIVFNSTVYVDNACFELQANGTIKVLKEISRILVTVNIRGNGSGGLIYVNSSYTGNGFNVQREVGGEFYNGSGILTVQQNSTISITHYAHSAGVIVGYDRNWAGVNITVLK